MDSNKRLMKWFSDDDDDDDWTPDPLLKSRNVDRQDINFNKEVSQIEEQRSYLLCRGAVAYVIEHQKEIILEDNKDIIFDVRIRSETIP